MKYFFTLIFIAIFISANAQSYPYLGDFIQDIPSSDELHDKIIARNHISSMTRTFKNFTRKGKEKRKLYVHVFSYDQKGNLLSYESKKESSAKQVKFNYFYKDTLFSGYTYSKRNRLIKSCELTRNDSMYVTDIIKKNKHNKIVARKHYDFDPTTTFVSKVTIYGKGNKELKAIEYSYYEDKKLKQAKEYKNGKLKKTWDYTCDLAGKDEKKQVKVCRNVSVDENGNRVETNRIVNTKGEVELRVNTFDKNDEMIKQLVYDDLKHRLKSEYTIIITKDGKETVYKSFNKRGKELTYQKIMYSNTNQIVLTEFTYKRKPRTYSKAVHTRNQNDLLTHSQVFGKKDRKLSENTFSYN